jgi:hypothetical protein
MMAQPDLSPRGWNGGPMKYGASLGRPSKGLTEHFTAEQAIEEAKRLRSSVDTLERCMRQRMVETDTRPDAEIREEIRQRLAEAYRLETMAATGKLADIKVSLRRIQINNGGYDSGGSYWGLGQPLYWAGSDCGTVDLWFRASDRDDAKEHVRETFPNVRFHR